MNASRCTRISTACPPTNYLRFAACWRPCWSPLDRKLALAPIDDESVTPDEAAAIQAGVSSLEQNGGVPLEEVLADLGLTIDDFHKMAENPAAEDAA